MTLRITLKEPWPDFMTFYGTTATAAGLVVPKKYLQQVGDDGFRKHPIGAGPYKFVSNSPGVEIVLEAYTGYWRRVPNVKRLVMKSVPEGTTRVAMLKKGEADIAYALDGEDAENVRRDPKLQLIPSKHASIYWIEFAEQWDPKSPWADKRVRQAAIYALDRQAINEASCLGFCPPTSIIVPRVMDFALQTPGAPYDMAKAKQLLREAGYPNGLDAGEFVPTPPFYATAEAAVNYLNTAGIRVRIRTMERAAFLAAWREKKLRGLFMAAVGNSGNAATRAAEFIYSKGSYAYGGYPDLDDMILQQARERDPRKREAILHRIQQLTIDRAMYLPDHGLPHAARRGPPRGRARPGHLQPGAISRVRGDEDEGAVGRRAAPVDPWIAGTAFVALARDSSGKAHGRRSMKTVTAVAIALLLAGCATAPTPLPAGAQTYVGEVRNWNSKNNTVTLFQPDVGLVHLKVTPEQLVGLQLNQTARMQGVRIEPADLLVLVPAGPVTPVPRGPSRDRRA